MPEVTLDALGWSLARAKEFEPFAAKGLVPARVSLEHNHVFRVLTGEGERLAETAGRVKHRAEGRHALPVVGDWIALRVDQAGERDQIRGILTRSTQLSRKAAGRETEEQVLAANIDTVFVVFGLDHDVNQRALERYLLLVARSGASARIVLNKADLLAKPDDAVAAAREVAGQVPVSAVSSKTRYGMPALEALMQPGVTFALLGPSGAGKSSLVNQLVSRDVLATGDVREWDARGRHTSVHRQLVVRDAGGLVVDTPGMRELQLWDTDETDAFADVADLAASCRFRDCQHDREPGCAVKEAVDAGVLDADRYGNYLKLQAERVATERKRDERAQADARRAVKSQHRALRKLYKNRPGGSR